MWSFLRTNLLLFNFLLLLLLGMLLLLLLLLGVLPLLGKLLPDALTLHVPAEFTPAQGPAEFIPAEHPAQPDFRWHREQLLSPETTLVQDCDETASWSPDVPHIYPIL